MYVFVTSEIVFDSVGVSDISTRPSNSNCTKMVSYLPKTEILIYISIYLGVLCFGVYQVYLVGDGESLDRKHLDLD